MLTEKIREDMKAAMKAKEKTRLSTLRSVIASIQTAQSESGSKELTDADVEKLIQGEVKKRTEAAEAFEQAGATEKAQQELEEQAILKSYLPEPLDDQELEKIVDETLAEGGWSQSSDMGSAIKAVNQKVAGRAEGRKVAELVKSKLN